MSKNLAIRQRVGRRLKRLRLDRGFSHERLAERAGNSSKHISQIERGNANVRIDTLAGIARALGVDVTDLFGPAPKGPTDPYEILTGEDPVLIEEVGRLFQRLKRRRARQRH